MKHRIQQADIDRGWIYCPDAVTFVTGIFPFDQSNSSVNMFDLRYQLRLHDLYDFTSVSYVSYEITMQHITTLNLLFSGKPQFRFNRHQNKVFLDIDWTRDVKVGDYVIVECYRKMDPTEITLTGTIAGNTTSNTVIGTGTKFDQELLEKDFITLDGSDRQVKMIISPTEMIIDGPLSNTLTGLTATKAGLSDVWNDRFLKKYATALIKLQWGNNLSKFSGIQMPGGVTLDGVRIATEAKEEIDKIEEELISYNVLPGDMIVG
jgi:sporulation protein YlmC with PRC-barrel domain